MINGWGAAMMGVIGVQISKGLITGEPFEILAGSMVFNIMAWFSSLSAVYIFSNVSWGQKKRDLRRAAGFNFIIRGRN